MRDYYKNIYKKGFRNIFIKNKIKGSYLVRSLLEMNTKIFEQIMFSTKEKKDIFLHIIKKN